MKILSINNLQNACKINEQNKYISHETLQRDTFTKSLSFGNLTATKAKEVVNGNSYLLEMFKEYNNTVKSFLSTFLHAGGKVLSDFVGNQEVGNVEILEKAIAEELQELRDENERLKNENSIQKEKILSLETLLDTLQKDKENISATPKKRGRKKRVETEIQKIKKETNSEASALKVTSSKGKSSKNNIFPITEEKLPEGLEKLKAIVLKTTFEDKHADKLKGICEVLIGKEEIKTMNNIKLNKNLMAKSLAVALISGKKSTEKVIEEYYTLLGLDVANI